MKPLFDEREFEALVSTYGKEARKHVVTLQAGDEKFFYDFKKNVERDRRGEVAFAVERKNGKIVIIRTSFYPKNIYRIPTGGISYGEDIIEALYREVKEELGLQVDIQKFLGAIEYNIYYNDEQVNFYSYVFLLKELSGNILTDALEDEVSEYREVDKQQLAEQVEILNNFKGSWKDWCTFRAQSTGFVLHYI